MSVRIKTLSEIERIEKENNEIIEKDIFQKSWGVKQNNRYDKILEDKFGNLFDFARSGSLKTAYEKIEATDLSDDLKSYAINRVANITASWLDESYIGQKDGVILCDDDKADWDFEYLGVQFDLKNSVLPRFLNNKYSDGKSINKDPDGFIRDMFFESSDGVRSNRLHKQSNRFFMIYYSKKDKEYSSGKIWNTKKLSKINFSARKKAIDDVFKQLTENNVFVLLKVCQPIWSSVHHKLKFAGFLVTLAPYK